LFCDFNALSLLPGEGWDENRGGCMDLFLMRHGVAESPDRYGDDGQRPLTAQGRHDQSRVARVLLPLLEPLDHLISSPLVRARQTADIVADTLQFDGQIEETTILASDCTLGAVLDLLQRYSAAVRILCVGHEPHMSRLSAVFLDGDGRSAIAFQPGSVMGLTFNGHPLPGQGRLSVFLRPVDALAMLAGSEKSGVSGK
jgi:phosphohistidine phosphatase